MSWNEAGIITPPKPTAPTGMNTHPTTPTCGRPGAVNVDNAERKGRTVAKVENFGVAKKYTVIYADPPWQYDNPKDNDPSMGGITYPTMTIEELRSLPVESISAPDCGLFLWATMPKLRQAFDVIDAWGFRYITCAFAWVKQNPNGHGIYSGLGHWTNGNAELCLFAKRGAPKRQAKNVKQIVLAPRSRHSAKPPEVRDRIVDLMGDVKRIELFARERAEGWDAWGNEL